MMRNKNHIGFLLLAVLLVLPQLVSCSDHDLDTENLQDGKLKINISILNNENPTRAAYIHNNRLDQTYFLDGSQIGVTAASTTDGSIKNPVNAPYVSVGNRQSTYNNQYWQLEDQSKSINFIADGEKLCGYYPYRSDVTTPTKIHLKVDSLADVMYAPWTLSTSMAADGSYLPLDENHPICNLTMHHAQAILAITIRNKGYADQANVYSTTFHGKGFGIQADLNAGTGVLSNFSDTTFTQIYPLHQALNFKVDSCEDYFYVFPNDQEQTITFLFNIDGYNQTASQKIALHKGYYYDFKFDMKSLNIQFNTVNIQPWDSASTAKADASPYTYDADSIEYVDMGMTDASGNSVLWAASNLGAATPADAGGYYMWGETIPYTSSNPVGPTYYTAGNIGYSSIARTAYDPVRAVLGNENYMPTLADWQNLCNTANYIWKDSTMTSSSRTTVRGYRVTSKKYPTHWIFIPDTGYHTYKLNGSTGAASDTIQYISSDLSTNGYYWASTQDVTDIPYQPYCFKQGWGITNYHACMTESKKTSVAYVVRPVKISSN